MDDLAALLRAHIAAAQAWRHLMNASLDVYGDDEYTAWEEAERELTRVLEAGRCG